MIFPSALRLGSNYTAAHGAKIRVLVTGSRGKSSLVRLICAGLGAKGLDFRGRITGVLPRELSRAGERLIIRNAPGDIAEMRWWLRQIPRDTEAVVMENSAVHPGLQAMAAKWLRPTVVVWTNARPDHQEVWGEGREAAAYALLQGIPKGARLVVSEEIMNFARIKEPLLAQARSILAVPCEELDFRLSNLNLARKALEFYGLLDEKSEDAMTLLPPDVGDFRVFHMTCGTKLASAFSANDIISTERLFSTLGWDEGETSLLFSDREDRPYRRASFGPFLRRAWREVLVQKRNARMRQMEAWIQGKQVFGCGNIAGAPLALLQKLTGENCGWTIRGA